MAKLLLAILAIAALALACSSDSSGGAFTPFEVGSDVELPISVEGDDVRIYWFEPATGDLAEIYSDPFLQTATFVPDGSGVVIHLDEDLLIVRSDGTEQLIRRADAGARLTDWSPDGKRPLFSDSEGIRERDIEGEETRILYEGDAQDAAWSHDGTKIALIDDQQLRVLDVETGETQALAADLTAAYLPRSYSEGLLAWSPDSTRIALGDWTIQEPVTQGRSDVYVVDLAGGEPRRLTDSARAKRHFAWSPDGRYLAYQHAMSDGDHLQVIDIDAGTLLELDLITNLPPQWVDDDRILVGGSDGVSIVRVDGASLLLVSAPNPCQAIPIGWGGGRLTFQNFCSQGV